jgi:hypothetical protein
MYQRELSVNWDKKERDADRDFFTFIALVTGEDYSLPHFATTYGE